MAASISIDLCHEMLDYLPTKTLKICSLANSSFRDLAQPKLFSHLTLIPKGNNWKDVRYWFLHQPRGQQLCKKVKEVTLFAAEFKAEEDVTAVSELLRSFSGLMQTLTFFCNGKWEDINPRLMEELKGRIFPQIRALIVYDSSLPFVDLLSSCSSLRAFEFRALYLYQEQPATSGLDYATPLRRLQDLTMSTFDGSFPSKRTALGACFTKSYSTIRSLSLCKVEATSFSFTLLNGFTSLVELALEISFYKSFVNKRDPKAGLIPLSDLSCLRRISFEIADPRPDHWSIFFSWIGRHITDIEQQSSSVVRLFIFSLTHPISQYGWKNSIPEVKKDATLGGREDMEQLKAFDALFAKSLSDLKFVLQTPVFTEIYRQKDEQEGFDLVAGIVKKWMKRWYEAGKLQIWREWLRE
ncbi:hypothetical protein DL96DRAFT_1589823 [Flagelloscypha sp. PMI_526]|nr:hypothetical protein DL96DRAFT_1589823 [Flagelloscypha sp. PMI_526]